MVSDVHQRRKLQKDMIYKLITDHTNKRANHMILIGPFICSENGWGAGIRTPIGRSRVGSPTVERHPNVVSERYDTLTLQPCQAVAKIKPGCQDGNPEALSMPLNS